MGEKGQRAFLLSFSRGLTALPHSQVPFLHQRTATTLVPQQQNQAPLNRCEKRAMHQKTQMERGRTGRTPTRDSNTIKPLEKKDRLNEEGVWFRRFKYSTDIANF